MRAQRVTREIAANQICRDMQKSREQAKETEI